MYGNKSIKHRKDGSKYKDFYYYGCKHRTMTRGHKCDYKKQTLEEIEMLDPDDRHYNRRKADLDDRLYRMYDKIDDLEQSLIEARAKKHSIESEKVTGDNIYKSAEKCVEESIAMKGESMYPAMPNLLKNLRNMEM